MSWHSVVQDVRCVIHYQLPASADVYVHRSGRTARGSKEGVTIALVTPKEAARYQGLQKAMDRPVPSEFPVDNTLMPSVSAFQPFLQTPPVTKVTRLPGFCWPKSMGGCSQSQSLHIEVQHAQ